MSMKMITCLNLNNYDESHDYVCLSKGKQSNMNIVDRIGVPMIGETELR